jgi:hypothetical protein
MQLPYTLAILFLATLPLHTPAAPKPTAPLVLAVKTPDTASAPRVRFAASPDSLVAAIIEALNSGDVKRLDALSFNKPEFLEVYPHYETDTSADRREFATGFYLRDNQKTLLRRMDEEGGRNVVLSRYDIEGPLVPYGPMVLYRGFRIWVKDGKGEREVKLIKSAARFHGGWKIWSFRDN